VGSLIEATTWGGLVKVSVHYSLVDGSGLTDPDNAVCDPINKKWNAETKELLQILLFGRMQNRFRKEPILNLNMPLLKFLNWSNKRERLKLLHHPFQLRH
jgi:hypothetical protein